MNTSKSIYINTDITPSIYPINEMMGHESYGLMKTYLNSINQNNIAGDIVELGCNRGLTSVFIQQNILNDDREFSCYDLFSPEIPEGQIQLPNERETDVAEPKLQDFINNFNINRTIQPEIHMGPFDPQYLPDKIAFALIDFDYYSVTKVAITNVLTRLVKGGVILIHDYHQEKWGEGIREACLEAFGPDYENSEHFGYFAGLAIWKN